MNYIFDPEWFKSKQKFLLWFLNTPLIRIWFRRVMRIKKYDCKEKITQITPNSISWGDKLIWNQKKGELEIERTTDFRTHNKYSKRLYHAFKYVWYLFHAWDLGFANNFAPQLNLGFDTLTVYPAAGANSPVDGPVHRDGVNESFATIRAGAGNAAYPSATTAYVNNTGNGGTGFVDWRRAYILFDTSDLTSGATISAGVLSLFIFSEYVQLGSIGECLVAATPTDDNNLVNGDYAIANFGTTELATRRSITTNSSPNAYHGFTLNASGLAHINKTGLSRFGNINSWDFDNTNGSKGGSGGSGWAWATADDTSGTKDPKLVITYSTSTAYTQTCSETLSLTDTISRSTKFNKSISETLSMTEAVSKSQGMSKSLTETLSLSDAISSAKQRGLLLLETLHITDTLQKTTRFAKTLTESISLTDTLASAKQFFVTLSETIGLTDVISKSTNFAKSLSETLHLTDVIKVTGWFWNYLFKRTSSYDYKSKSTNTWTDKTKSTDTWTYKDK